MYVLYIYFEVYHQAYIYVVCMCVPLMILYVCVVCGVCLGCSV